MVDYGSLRMMRRPQPQQPQRSMVTVAMGQSPEATRGHETGWRGVPQDDGAGLVAGFVVAPLALGAVFGLVAWGISRREKRRKQRRG